VNSVPGLFLYTQCPSPLPSLFSLTFLHSPGPEAGLEVQVTGQQELVLQDTEGDGDLSRK
jgi:hypothetical protein